MTTARSTRSISGLLSLWERSGASLRDCRDALDAFGDAAGALAYLDAQIPSAQPRQPGRATPVELLAAYQRGAQKWKDVRHSETFPRSLVWASERTSSRIPPSWWRHRYFLGAPVTRWFDGDGGAAAGLLHYGGYMRVEREPMTPEESALALVDLRWAVDQLARFSRQSGARVAVELRGVSGWVDGSGADEKIARTFVQFSAGELDHEQAWALLDARPDRRLGVPDCGWAPQIEENLLRGARLLDSVEISDEERPVDGELGAAPVYELFLARARHRGGSSFTEVLDRLLFEHQGRTLGPTWLEISRDQAAAIWRGALTRSQAYDVPLMEAADVERLVAAFLASFAGDALFYRNQGAAVIGSTFETGAAVVDTDSVGLLFIGDED